MTATSSGAAPARRGLAAKPAFGLARILAVFALLLLLAAWARPRPLDFWLGLPFVLAGAAVRVWAAGHLVKTRELVVSGPYAYTRNPLYLGRLLLFSGWALMARLPRHGNLVVLLFGLALFFGYYLPRKERVEGARLRDRHGEAYLRYEAHVPALWPRLRAYPADTRVTWRWERFCRNREYLMLLLEAALLALFGAEAWLL